MRILAKTALLPLYRLLTDNWAPLNKVYLGHGFHKHMGFAGLIDEVHVFDRVLTPEEIRHLHETNQLSP